MLSSINIWSRLTRRMISFIASFPKVVAALKLCEAYPTVTLQLHCWCVTNAKKARVVFLKLSVKFQKSPNQTLLKYKCFAETAWQYSRRNSAGIWCDLDWQGSFSNYLPGRFPASSFNQACLHIPALGSPVPSGQCATRTDLPWSWALSAFVGYFTLGLKILNIWQNTIIFSSPHFVVVQCARGRPYDVLPKTLQLNACSEMMVQKHSCRFSFFPFNFCHLPECIIKVKIVWERNGRRRKKIGRGMREGKEISCRALSREWHQIHRKIGVAVGQFRLCRYRLTQQQFNLILTLQLMSLRAQLCNWDQWKLN